MLIQPPLKGRRLLREQRPSPENLPMISWQQFLCFRMTGHCARNPAHLRWRVCRGSVARQHNQPCRTPCWIPKRMDSVEPAREITKVRDPELLFLYEKDYWFKTIWQDTHLAATLDRVKSRERRPVGLVRCTVSARTNALKGKKIQGRGHQRSSVWAMSTSLFPFGWFLTLYDMCGSLLAKISSPKQKVGWSTKRDGSRSDDRETLQNRLSVECRSIITTSMLTNFKQRTGSSLSDLPMRSSEARSLEFSYPVAWS